MKTLSAAIVCLILGSVQAQLTEAEAATIDTLRRSVIQSYNWEILTPGIDEESLEYAQDAPATWEESARLLDAHAAVLDGLSDRLLRDDSLRLPDATSRSLVQIARADTARAIEIGDRQRAGRRVAMGLELSRHFMSGDADVLDRLSSIGLLYATMNILDDAGTEHFDPKNVTPAMERLAATDIPWRTSGKYIESQWELIELLRTLYAEFGVDPGDSLDIPHALPKVFEGSWAGSLQERSAVPNAFDAVISVEISRSPEDPALMKISYKEWWNAGAEFPGGDPLLDLVGQLVLDNEIPEMGFTLEFRLPDSVRPGHWSLVPPEPGSKPAEEMEGTDARLTAFEGGRLVMLMSASDLADEGALMYSFQINPDGSMTFESMGLFRLGDDPTPAPSMLRTATLQRTD